MKKPTSFKLAGKKWKINYVDKLPGHSKGVVFYERREVQVAARCDYYAYTEAEQFETLLHEIVHAVLDAHFPKHNKEKFVTEFANKLAKTLMTAKV